MKFNGVAHIALTVNRFELCVPFYEKLFSFLEMDCVFKGEDQLYFVGGKTAIGIGRCGKAYQEEAFIQTRIGLHHLCLRAYTREDVDNLYQQLLKMNAKIAHPPEEGPWGPGYYSVLFEDPDEMRWEMNYVRSLAAEGASFNPSQDYR